MSNTPNPNHKPKPTHKLHVIEMHRIWLGADGNVHTQMGFLSADAYQRLRLDERNASLLPALEDLKTHA